MPPRLKTQLVLWMVLPPVQQRTNLMMDKIAVHMNATEYCDIVMQIANTPGNSLFEEVDMEEPVCSPRSPMPFVAGQSVHESEKTPSAPTDKLYTKSESLQYSETIVFGKLQTIYEALVGAASDFEYEDIANDTGNVFGYVFFSQYNRSVKTLSQLLYQIGLLTNADHSYASNGSDASSTSQSISSSGSISSSTQASLIPSTSVNNDAEHTKSLVSLRDHIQHAVALQHFLQTTIMQPARYVKNACIQLVNTYVESIIHGVFHTKLDNTNRALIASLSYKGSDTLQYTITGNRCLRDPDGEAGYGQG